MLSEFTERRRSRCSVQVSDVPEDPGDDLGPQMNLFEVIV